MHQPNQPDPTDPRLRAPQLHFTRQKRRVALLNDPKPPEALLELGKRTNPVLSDAEHAEELFRIAVSDLQYFSSVCSKLDQQNTQQRPKRTKTEPQACPPSSPPAESPARSPETNTDCAALADALQLHKELCSLQLDDRLSSCELAVRCKAFAEHAALAKAVGTIAEHPARHQTAAVHKRYRQALVNVAAQTENAISLLKDFAQPLPTLKASQEQLRAAIDITQGLPLFQETLKLAMDASRRAEDKTRATKGSKDNPIALDDTEEEPT